MAVELVDAGAATSSRLGATTVMYTATNAVGHAASATQAVTVVSPVEALVDAATTDQRVELSARAAAVPAADSLEDSVTDAVTTGGGIANVKALIALVQLDVARHTIPVVEANQLLNLFRH